MTERRKSELNSRFAPAFSNVSRETLDRLEIYESLLIRWQTVKNLVGPSTLPNLWTRHFADSAQLASLAGESLVWVDLGSGAGFPGLVMAILLADNPGAIVHLIESDSRKCAFLREVIRATGAPAKIHNARIETVLTDLNGIQIVTARALTALPGLLELSSPLLEKGAQGLFLKGQDVASELTDASIFSSVDLEFLSSNTDAGARIVRAKWRDVNTRTDNIPRT